MKGFADCPKAYDAVSRQLIIILECFTQGLPGSMVTRSQRDGKDARRGVGCHFLAIGRDDDNRRNRLIPILDFGFGPLHKQQSPYLSLIPDQKVRAIERARSSMVGDLETIQSPSSDVRVVSALRVIQVRSGTLCLIADRVAIGSALRSV